MCRHGQHSAAAVAHQPPSCLQAVADWRPCHCSGAGGRRMWGPQRSTAQPVPQAVPPSGREGRAGSLRLLEDPDLPAECNHMHRPCQNFPVLCACVVMGGGQSSALTLILKNQGRGASCRQAVPYTLSRFDTPHAPAGFCAVLCAGGKGSWVGVRCS
jgi:hypothetical protein